MPTVRVESPQGAAEVGYVVDGDSGPPLLLLHGTTSNRTSWDAVVPTLAEQHIVVRTEFPGSGESPQASRPLEVEDLAWQSIAVMDHLGFDRYHVGGWSLGAVVAIAVGALVPERVKSIASVAGWLRTDARMKFTFGLWDRLISIDPELFARYAMADGFTSATFELLGDSAGEMIPLMAAGIAAGSAAQIELDTRVDITALAATITAPTLIIGGLEDRWIDPTHTRAVRDVIMHGELVELPVGHLIPQEQAGPLAVLIAQQIARAD